MTEEVRHNEAQQQYELVTPHGLAVAVYRQQGDKVIFTHSEVPPADEGRGIGAKLVKAALADVKQRGLGAVGACSFVAAIMRRNPDLVRS